MDGELAGGRPVLVAEADDAFGEPSIVLVSGRMAGGCVCGVGSHGLPRRLDAH